MGLMQKYGGRAARCRKTTGGAAFRTVTAAAMAFGALAGLAAPVAAGAAEGRAPGAALAGTMRDDEMLRRLDVMLMVNGLRCRTTSDDYMADYGRFAASHMAELNAAAGRLRSALVARGERNPTRALDRMSVVMANEYGTGHPWLDCRQLGAVTRGLADVRGTPTLLEAASQLLGRDPAPHLALAGR